MQEPATIGRRQLNADVWALEAAREIPEPQGRDRMAIDAAIAALEPGTHAVDCPANWLWHYEPQFENGLAAYDAWLADLESPVDLPDDQYRMYWQGHAVLFEQLLDARRAACAFAERLAGRADPAAPACQEISERDTRLLEEGAAAWPVPYCRGGYWHPNGWRIEERTELVMGSDARPRYADGWSDDERQRTAEAARHAKRVDADVLDLLTEALAALA